MAIASDRAAIYSTPPEGELALLRERLKELEQERQTQAQRIEQLLDYIALLKRKRFAPSSERWSPEQFGLFDEAELEAVIAELEPEPAPNPPAAPPNPSAPAKAAPVRRPLPAHLPRVERLIELSAEAQAALGEGWGCIGYDRSEQLAIIPRQPYVIRTLRAKYAPLDPTAEGGVVIAPRPAQILPKAIAHSSLLAEIVVAKYADALPLYRQEALFARDGVDLPRQSMAGWILALGAKLTPVCAAMKDLLGAGGVLHIDETRVQVLFEPEREATQQSFMWVYRGGAPARPVILFDYSETRSAEAPRQFLAGHSPPGLYLVSDGYAAYNVLVRDFAWAGHAACWAHVRRKFVEATAGRSHSAAAHQMIALTAKLYALERGLKDADPQTRRVEREIHTRPVLATIKAWLDSTAARVPPKSLLGNACAYALGLWPQLSVFLADGHIPLDNNPAENAIRPFVVGRKNWLFSATPDGAKASATLYSLIESAKANGLEPRAYLHFLFERLPTAATPADIAALVPQRLTPKDIALPPVSLPAPGP
jgi:transposase